MSPPDDVNQSSNTPPVRSSGSERRREHRRPMQSKAVLTVLDGALANSTHDIMTRDLSTDGVSFLLPDSLSAGQSCRIDISSNGGPAQSYLCEVIRTRQLSNGKHEMAVKFRSRT